MHCVVGLGLCVVDHLYVVERLGLGEGRLRYSERRVTGGGMVGNALAQAARLGCRTEALSWIGDDPPGRELRRALRGHGVGTRGLLLSRDAITTVAVCLVSRRDGERRFLVPDRRALERRAPAFDLACIRPGTVLLVDGHFSAQALRAVKRARRVGAPVIGDFHHFGPVARRLLPHVDYPIVSEEFVRSHPARGPRGVLRALAEGHGGTPVVTLGERGGLYWQEGRIARFAARRVRVRDTTGAGDVFHGAFAAGLHHGLGLEGTIALAARAAALSCTALGATGRLLRRDEVRALRSRDGRSRAPARSRPS